MPNNINTITPENEKANNRISTTTGKLELRKLWSVPKAEYIYALFVEVKTVDTSADTDTTSNEELSWQCPQGYVGDEEWAQATAAHFHLPFPEEEYREPKSDTSDSNKDNN